MHRRLFPAWSSHNNDKDIKKTNFLLDRKNTVKEMIYGNLRKIYIMQAKSCRNIFRVYQKIR